MWAHEWSIKDALEEKKKCRKRNLNAHSLNVMRKNDETTTQSEREKINGVPINIRLIKHFFLFSRKWAPKYRRKPHTQLSWSCSSMCEALMLIGTQTNSFTKGFIYISCFILLLIWVNGSVEELKFLIFAMKILLVFVGSTLINFNLKYFNNSWFETLNKILKFPVRNLNF